MVDVEEGTGDTALEILDLPLGSSSSYIAMSFSIMVLSFGTRACRVGVMQVECEDMVGIAQSKSHELSDMSSTINVSGTAPHSGDLVDGKVNKHKR